MATKKRPSPPPAKSPTHGKVKRGGLTKRGRHKIPPKEAGSVRALKTPSPGRWVVTLQSNMKKKLVFEPAQR